MHKSLLEGMQFPFRGQSFNGRDLLAVSLHGEQDAIVLPARRDPRELVALAERDRDQPGAPDARPMMSP